LLVLTWDGLFLVDPKGGGVTLTQQMSISSDTQYRVDLDGARGELVTPDLWPLWHDTMLDAIILVAAQAVGGARFALDITVQYDIQLYFRRAKQLQLSWWDDRYLEELVAAEVLD